MDNSTVNVVRVLDMLGEIRREVVKACCLTWDVQVDMLEPLTAAVKSGNVRQVRMIAEGQANDCHIKTEIAGDLLYRLGELIDGFKAEIETSTTCEGGNVVTITEAKSARHELR